MTSNVVGLFDDMFHAQSAIADLEREGVPRADISVMANETVAGDEEVVVVTTEESSLAGAGTGAAVGGAAGLALGLAAVAVPGVGPILAAGPILAGLSGALMGAAAGGIIGALVDAGVPQTDAVHFAEGVRRGGIVVTARVRSSLAPKAGDIFRANGAVDIHDRVSFWRESGWTGYSQSLPVYSREQMAQERAKLAARASGASQPLSDGAAVDDPGSDRRAA